MHKRLGAEILRPGRKTRDKPEMAKQLQGFNEHMQRLMDNYETWTGVPERFKCRLRDTEGKLPPIALWQFKPRHWKE